MKHNTIIQNGLSLASFSLVLLMFLESTLTVSSNQPQQQLQPNSNRRPQRLQQNFFDPIYAFDDIEAQSISSSSAQNHQRPGQHGVTSISSSSSTNKQASADSRPHFTSSSAASSPASSFSSSGTLRPLSPTSVRALAGSSGGGGRATTLSSGPALVTSSFRSSAPPAGAVTSTNSNPRVKKADKEPHHWSALENYYQKIREQAAPAFRLQPPTSQSNNNNNHQRNSDGGSLADLAPFFQQELGGDFDHQQQPLTGLKQLQSSYSPAQFKYQHPAQLVQQQYIIPNVPDFNAFKPTAIAFQQQQLPQQQQQAKANPAFNLPLSPSVANDRRLLLDSLRNQPQRDDAPSVYQQTAPGISRKGDGLIDFSTEQQQQPLSPNLFDQDNVRAAIRYAAIKAASDNNNNNNYQHSSSSSSSSLAGFASSSSSDDSNRGKYKYVEWRKLPELLLIQQQQQRVKHQQETFGSLYDHQRTKEQLQEEAFCGPRNYINLNLVSPLLQSPTNNDKQQQQRNRMSPLQLARLQLQLQETEGAGSLSQLDVPVALSNDEYPSHMGIYNGSSPSEDNYLCGATWVDEQFALTVASCIKSFVSDPKQLSVRAGEWNLGKNKVEDNNNNQNNNRPTVVRQVEQVFVFPKYNVVNSTASDHNLALIKFTKPINYLEVPYICPACQMHSRSSIKTSACWTPVRNITLTEYFDAEGEGETKEKKNVNMIELPVRLIANDDTECYRQTKVEFFHFQHPNYICSGDFKRQQDLWRAKLNQTDYFGSGIYCNEAGNLSLVSILHPIYSNTSSSIGYLDLSYYKPWIRKVISSASSSQSSPSSLNSLI